MEEVIAKIITIENGFKEIENIAKNCKNNDSKSVIIYQSTYIGQNIIK